MSNFCFSHSRTIGKRRLQRGVTSIEYALVGSLIAVAVMGSVMLLGDETFEMYDYVSSNVTAAVSRD